MDKYDTFHWPINGLLMFTVCSTVACTLITWAIRVRSAVTTVVSSCRTINTGSTISMGGASKQRGGCFEPVNYENYATLAYVGRDVCDGREVHERNDDRSVRRLNEF